MLAFLGDPNFLNLENLIQTLEGVAGLGVLVVGPRLLVCHHHRCLRWGRFRHGPYRLCKVHHPDVPSDGRITQEHINQIGGDDR